MIILGKVNNFSKTKRTKLDNCCILMNGDDSFEIPKQNINGVNPVKRLWFWMTNSYV